MSRIIHCRRGARGREPAPAAERGFALLLVIWVLMLLSVLAAGLAADTATHMEIARNRIDAARARAVADAGVALAVIGLRDPDPQTRWHADGSVEALRYDNCDLAVTVFDEGGKIDVNQAAPELMAGLLDELGMDHDQESAFIDAIMARRQWALANGTAPSGGAITDVSSLPFAAVAELQPLPGMTHSLYERMRPYVTVYSGAPTVNPLSASRTVLLAIPGISPQDVDFYLNARTAETTGQPTVDMPSLGGAGRYVAVNQAAVVTVEAKATTENGAVFTREAVLTLSQQVSTMPYTVLQWTRPVEPDEVAQIAEEPSSN